MDQNNQNTEHRRKFKSSPDSPRSNRSPNSSIPTFKIENEDNSDETSENRHTDQASEKPEPTTSTNKNSEKDASTHLIVPSKENRMIRSSSLKIGKSSDDGTSSDKKIVRFADALGLDLVDVKVFTNDGSIPNIPSNAFSDLKVNLSNDTLSLSPSKTKIGSTQEQYVLVPQFEQPVSDANFLNRVKEQKVCLENVVTHDLQVTGIVRTSNLHYQKVVLALYTTDNWDSEQEQPAKYVEGSSDTVTDKFIFTIHPRHMKPGDKLIFVVKYEVLDQEFWDNNNSNNYILLCKAKSD